MIEGRITIFLLLSVMFMNKIFWGLISASLMLPFNLAFTVLFLEDRRSADNSK